MDTNIYENQSTSVINVVRSKDYNAAIKIYANKGLLAQVAQTCFGQKRDEFVSFAKRVLLDDDVKLNDALKRHIPAIS